MMLSSTDPALRVFPNRCAAGRELAAVLATIPAPDPIVLALPRGGVPVGYEVAHLLGAPLDVLVVRKVGAPDQPELAMGAVGPEGVTVVDWETMALLGVDERTFETVARGERHEVERRGRLFRGNEPAPDLHGKSAILVDDGLATGSTMMAAVDVARRLGAGMVIVAAPVGSPEACRRLSQRADRVVSLIVPDAFGAVGYWYQDFSQTDDAEVRRLLRLARLERDAHHHAGPGATPEAKR
jgi:putative phosphoribosyl transferase